MKSIFRNLMNFQSNFLNLGLNLIESEITSTRLQKKVNLIDEVDQEDIEVLQDEMCDIQKKLSSIESKNIKGSSNCS